MDKHPYSFHFLPIMVGVCTVFIIGFFAFAIPSQAAPPSTCIPGTNVYYISQTGSDANSQAQAKSKSTPWKHSPGMASFTGTYSHTAGDCFFFKGGETWVAADHMTIANGGTSTSLMDYYGGGDQTWYVGGSWSRPIYDQQSVSGGAGNYPPYKVFNFNASYIIFDNFELIRMACSVGNNQQVWSPNAQNGIYITNNYIHNYQSPQTGCGSGVEVINVSGAQICNGLFDHNIVDGSDGKTGYITENIVPNYCSPVTNNVIHDVCSAVNGYIYQVAYNLIYNVGPWTSGVPNCNTLAGFHPDGIQTAIDSDVHDNVLYNVTGEVIQVSPKSSPAWPVSHIYNNVVYSNGPVNIELGTGGDPPSSNGVAYIYNNTLECGSQNCLSMYMSIASLTLNNNHLISNSGGAAYCINKAPFNCSGPNGSTVTTLNYTPGTELYQTNAQAAATGYTANQTYVYSPTSANSPTVGKAVNNTSSCNSTILVCKDATYGSVTISNNSPIFGRTQLSRPTSGSWDIGAYQFSSSGGGGDITPPSTPSGLSASAISSSQINLSWTASTDNVGVSGYKIYRGGVQVGTSGSTSYSDTGLTASTAYTYTVSAYDAAGNNSSQSTGVNATTLGGTIDCIHNVWQNLEACGWPGPSNTGPNLSQCPGGLTTNSGATTRTITISTPNTVISCQNITGGLQITAQNVTIKNSIISYDGGAVGGSGVININDGASATIDHVELNGLNHTHACIWDEGIKGNTLAYSMLAKNINCHGANDGIFSWWWSSDKNAGAGSDFLIQDSYFHDFTENAANGHIDGYQTEGAQNGTITHNTYLTSRVPGDVSVSGGGVNSSISFWDSYLQTTPTGLTAGNFTISNNLIAGGGFAVYVEDYMGSSGSATENVANSAVGGNSLTNVRFINNVFSTYLNSCVGQAGVWFYRYSWPPYYGGPTDLWNVGGSLRSGNTVLETGENIDKGGPSGCEGYNTSPAALSSTPDTTPPSTPTGLTASAISSSQINLTWTPSTDNVGVSGYKIYRGGIQIGTASTNSYSDTGLSASTNYTYTISAYDAAGNASSQSTSASATTSGGTPPPPSGCIAGIASWQNSSFSSQSGSFTIQFDSTPKGVNIDGVIGLSTNPASAYTDLAAIIRFNDTGTIDARNGINYSSLVSLPYITNTVYHFVMTVNVPQHTYSVTVTPQGGATTVLATNYAFRETQTGITSLSYLNTIDSPGPEQTCNISVTSAVTPPPSTKFTAGQRIQTTSNLNVRATASATGTLLGTQALGSLGTIISGGTSVDGYYWWNVNYDNAPDGWSVEDYLTAYTAAKVGDFNGDGLVNSIDLSLMTTYWNQNNPTYDLNHDGIVNSLDYVIMVQNWSL